MTNNVVNFPKNTATNGVVETKRKQVNGFAVFLSRVPTMLWRAIWVITVLVWPIVKWPLSIEVFWQLLKTMYYWNTPGVHAGWTFLAHFTVLTVLTYFVSAYKPKGM